MSENLEVNESKQLVRLKQWIRCAVQWNLENLTSAFAGASFTNMD